MVLLLSILLLADVGYSVYSLNAAKSLRPWNQDTFFIYPSEASNEQHILIVGDSIAAGLGASSQSTTLFDRLGQHFSSHSRVILENQAVSGYKTKDVLNTGPTRSRYDKAIIIVGSNDLFRFTKLDAFEIQMNELIKRYARLATQVVLVGPGRVYGTSGTPVVSKPFYYQRAKQIGKVMQLATAQYQNIAYVNPHDDLPLRDYGDTEAIDNFHPNDTGHEYWFDMVMLGFQALATNKPIAN